MGALIDKLTLEERQTLAVSKGAIARIGLPVLPVSIRAALWTPNSHGLLVMTLDVKDDCPYT